MLCSVVVCCVQVGVVFVLMLSVMILICFVCLCRAGVIGLPNSRRCTSKLHALESRITQLETALAEKEGALTAAQSELQSQLAERLVVRFFFNFVIWMSTVLVLSFTVCCFESVFI